MVKLNWRYKETADSEYAFVKNYAGYKITVQDCDGDFSYWEIRKEDVVIAAG